MKIIKMLAKNTAIKCPYIMTPTRIVLHNTANDASARNEIAYMSNNNRKVSFHYAVDDKEIIQGIEENRNSWNAGDGNGKGNREGIAIEICYSKSGGERFIKAEQNATDLIVDILKRYKWDITKVTKHQDYSKKYCPHRTLDMGWDRFIKMIEAKLNPIVLKPVTNPVKTPVYTKGIYEALYNMKVRTGAGTQFRHKLKRELTRDGQKNCVFGLWGTYKVGTRFTAQAIINNLDGSVWAKRT